MNWRIIILIPLLALGCIFVGKYATGAPLTVLAIAAACAIGLVTFQNPENGLIVLVFSMMLSPQIIVYDIPGRPVTLRVDDLLIIAVFIAWLGNITVTKDWKGFVKTPFDLPMLLLLILYVVSTARGIVQGTVAVPLKSLFFTLKYFEYFVLYWLTANIIVSKETVQKYLNAGLITLFIVVIYSYSQFGGPGGIAAPFEWNSAEPASLGGYFLVVYAVVFAFLLNTESVRQRIFCACIALILLPPFIKTHSRASYLALAAMLVTMLLFTKKRRMLLGSILLISVFLFPLLFQGLYGELIKRTMVTFTGGHTEKYTSYQVDLAGRTITDESALARIASWHWVINERFSKNILNMLIGAGVTGLGFIEGQFFLVLGESGIVGALLFYGLLFRIATYSYHVYRTSIDTVPQCLSLAAFCALAGLLIQSLTTNTFIIVRIMEPFWFLTALVIIAPVLYETGTSEEQTRAPSLKDMRI